MTINNRFCVLDEDGRISIQTKELPPLKAEEALLRIELCGICGTDYRIINRKEKRRYPYYNLGHEYSAVVEATGECVRSAAPGDRVVINPNHWCGHCENCRRGLLHLCTLKTEKQVSKSNGGFADYAIVHADLLHKIPPDLAPERAIFIEPLSCCLHALNRTTLRPAGRIAILGGGAIGQLSLLLLRMSRADFILLCETVDSKRRLALQNGADCVVDPIEINLAEQYQDSMDLVVESTGSPQPLLDAINIAGYRGTVLAMSLYNQADLAAIKPQQLVQKELNLVGSIFTLHMIPTAIQIVSQNRRAFSSLLSSKHKLEDLPRLLMEPKSPEAIKVAIEP
jgi:threonine dehydrogenase-like Zn-dependent dehydrogenase